jgi:hypothetical protein
MLRFLKIAKIFGEKLALLTQNVKLFFFEKNASFAKKGEIKSEYWPLDLSVDRVLYPDTRVAR